VIPMTTSPMTTGPPSTLPELELRQLGSDLLPALSHPLTALCCSLELALQQSLTAEEYRDSVSNALIQAERVSWLTMGIRELFEAGQAGEDCEVLPLQVAVACAIDDVLLVAEAARVRICWVAGSAFPVLFEAQPLRSALFHLLGFVVGCGRRGSVVRFELEECGEQSQLRPTVSGENPGDDQTSGLISADDDPHRKLAQRLGLGIAHAVFEAAGGSFRVERKHDDMKVEVRLARARTR
jgi:hypothetical protein